MRKPTPKASAIRAALARAKDDQRIGFCEELHGRASTLLSDNELPKSLIALEMMVSAVSAFEGGLKHEDISSAYPVRAWREDTVEIPRAWVLELALGWKAYKEAPTGKSFGEILALEGGGQGKSRATQKLQLLNDQIKLSNLVLVEYLSERAQHGKGSWERSRQVVADQQNISVDTVERAFDRIGKRTLMRMARKGHIDEGGTTS